MDSRQAKSILSNYRPGETNSTDPVIAEALEVTRRDPELAIWFGQHCAEFVQHPTERIAPSTSLDTERKKQSAADKDDAQRVIPFGGIAFVMVAITVAIIGWMVLSSYEPPPSNAFSDYRDRMGRLVQRGYPMQALVTTQEQIRAYFRTNSGAWDFEMPRALDKFPGRGAAVFTWHSQPVSLFGLEVGDNTNVYLFLAPRSVFRNPPALAETQYVRIGKLMTAGWSQDNKVYLLAGPGDASALKKFLE